MLQVIVPPVLDAGIQSADLGEYLEWSHVTWIWAMLQIIVYCLMYWGYIHAGFWRFYLKNDRGRPKKLYFLTTINKQHASYVSVADIFKG